MEQSRPDSYTTPKRSGADRLCGGCGYNLTGLPARPADGDGDGDGDGLQNDAPSARCPECGAVNDLSEPRPRPRTPPGVWIVWGFTVLMFVVFARAVEPWPWWGDSPRSQPRVWWPHLSAEQVVLLSLGIIASIALITLLRRQRLSKKTLALLVTLWLAATLDAGYATLRGLSRGATPEQKAQLLMDRTYRAMQAYMTVYPNSVPSRAYLIEDGVAADTWFIHWGGTLYHPSDTPPQIIPGTPWTSEDFFDMIDVNSESEALIEFAEQTAVAPEWDRYGDVHLSLDIARWQATNPTPVAFTFFTLRDGKSQRPVALYSDGSVTTIRTWQTFVADENAAPENANFVPIPP